MYLPIGNSYLIPIRDIVALCRTHPTRMLKTNAWENYAKPYISVAGGCIRSYIVTEDRVYGSPIALETLVERYKRSFCQIAGK